MAKIITQLHIFLKNFMEQQAHGVNIVGVGNTNQDKMTFEALCSEEVNFLSNQGVVIVQTTRGRVVTKVGLEKKGRNIKFFMRYYNLNWKDEEKDKYVPPRRRKILHDFEGCRSEETLLSIPKKEEVDKMLKVST